MGFKAERIGRRKGGRLSERDSIEGDDLGESCKRHQEIDVRKIEGFSIGGVDPPEEQDFTQDPFSTDN